MRLARLVEVVLVALVGVASAGCASIPGETGEEQAEAVESLVQRTLADLYKQDPAAEAAIAGSVGYVVMSNKITKIPLVGAGSGYGVAIETRSGPGPTSR